MTEKIILITGSTDGIGKEAAIQLAKEGYHVIIHGRSEDKALKTLKEIQLESLDGNISYIVGDLSSFTQIKKLALDVHSKFEKIDVLINNAGVLNNDRKLTEQRLEETIVVNYIAPFYLTYLLIDLLIKADSSRIVNVASQVHSNHLDFSDFNYEDGYTAVKAYSRSKTCLMMFTYLLAQKLKKYNVSVNCLHPGVINTKLLLAAWGESVGTSVNKGADALIYAAISEKLKGVTGVYLTNNRIETSKDITYEKEIQEKLWSKTEEILGVSFNI